MHCSPAAAADGAPRAAPPPAERADPTTELRRRCHDLLIAPLGLVDGEPLLRVPDQDLYALPFAAPIPMPGENLRAQTRRPPHFRANKPRRPQ